MWRPADTFNFETSAGAGLPSGHVQPLSYFRYCLKKNEEASSLRCSSGCGKVIVSEKVTHRWCEARSQAHRA